jgi:hypothetical protein
MPSGFPVPTCGKILFILGIHLMACILLQKVVRNLSSFCPGFAASLIYLL